MAKADLTDQVRRAFKEFDTLSEIKAHHYARNENQDSDVSYLDVITGGYKQQPAERAAFHRLGGKENSNNSKWMSGDGHAEYVFRYVGTAKDGQFELVQTPLNLGTYNFVPRGYGHLSKDVRPWILWGNSEEDAANWTWSERKAEFDASKLPYFLQKVKVRPVQEWLGSSADDIFSASGRQEDFDGRGGWDTVSYIDSKRAVVVNLAKGIGHEGQSEGDKFRSIEALIGSKYGDILVGDSAGNRMLGLAGRDILSGGGGNDTLSGGGQSDTLYGGNKQDSLRGGRGSDELYGGAGRDSFSGGQGADTIYGGSGVDTAIYSANRANYEIKPSGSTLIVDGRQVGEGRDILRGVEILSFADGDVRVRDLRNEPSGELVAGWLLDWTWDITGRDQKGNVFAGTLDFDDVAPMGDGWTVEGSIDWTTEDNVTFVIGIAEATLSMDGAFETESTYLASGPDPRFAAANYFGSFASDFTAATGNWSGNRTVPGSWAASKADELSGAADLDLAGSRWYLLGEDRAGTGWEADVWFDRSESVDDGVAVEGRFDWHAIGTTRSATEYFEATVSDDFVFRTIDTWYIFRPTRFSEGTYTWEFNARGDQFSGSWKGGTPGTFEGRRIEEPSGLTLAHGAELGALESDTSPTTYLEMLL